MIGNKEKALLHVAKSQLNLDDDLYREILRQEAGVTSAIELTSKGFDAVLRRFRSMGFRRRNTSPQSAREAGATVTRAQLNKIAELYSELGWTESQRQNGFNRRQTGKPWPQTRAEANKVLEGLKALRSREQKICQV